MKTIRISTPFTEKIVRSLSAGTQIELSGAVYTMRDAAHKRLCELLDSGQRLPVELAGQVVYFVGPTPASHGHPAGSAGPTTSYRMDAYSPRLIREAGLMGMIGKGDRGEEVIEAMKEGPCVYFAATGGAGALLSKCIISSEVICYEDLGPEAIHRFILKDFPLVTAIDSRGGNLYRLNVR